MVKFVALLKRKPGITLHQFIELYEQRHARFAAPHLPGMRHYERRFLRPYGNPVDGTTHEAAYDVITEIWFDDRESLDKAMANVSRPQIAQAFADDEQVLFDREHTRVFTIEQESATLSAKAS